MDFNSSSPFPEGVISFLDTDLYKLTMQCAVFKFFKDVPVTYAFTNRTPDKKLSRAAFKWLEEQIRSMCLYFIFSPKLRYAMPLFEKLLRILTYPDRARQHLPV